MATTLATAVATVAWPTIEWLTNGKPTVLGLCSGAVAGLVMITPASGFVTANGAVMIGLLAGTIPYPHVQRSSPRPLFGYDDALDTGTGIHGVGGTLGALVTGFVATPEANPNLNTNLADVVGKTLWLEQLKAMGLTLVLAIAGTFLVGTAVKWLVGFRLDAESEEDGLDQADHGEAGYHLDDAGGLADMHQDSHHRSPMPGALAGASESPE